MGTSLFGLKPKNTYQGLLKTTANTAIDATLRTISDGLGNDTPLQLSTTKVQINSNVDIYKESPIGIGLINNNSGVNMPNGTVLIQEDYIGRRNGSTATLFRTNVTYNGDGTTRRGRFSMSVSESSGFGSNQFVLTQYLNQKVNIMGYGAGSYIDDAISPTTANNIHAGNIINTSGTLPILSLDASGLSKHVFYQNGNIAFNNTSDMASIVGIKGAGATSATTSLLVQNSSGTDALRITDDGLIAIFNNKIYDGANQSKCFQITGNRNLISNFDAIECRVYDGSGYNVGLEVLGNNAESRVKIGGGSIDNSAKLQIDSTTKGFLPPRMTDAQARAIVTPANGLIVYNTTIAHLCCYQGGAWVKFSHTPM